MPKKPKLSKRPEYGRLLPDPEGLLEGDGTQVRQLVLRRRGEIREEKRVPLILEAAMIATERRVS